MKLPLLIFFILLFSCSNGWIERAPTPKQGGYGEAVIGTADAVYIIRAYSTGNAYFWKYDLNNDCWEEILTWDEPFLPRPKTGTSMAWDYNNYLYVMFGGAYRDEDRRYFYRYNIKNGSWERLPDTPFSQGAGDAITYCAYDNKIYAIMGNKDKGSVFASFSIENQTWEILPFIWNSTDDGCSLVWTGGKYLYALRGEYMEIIPNGEFARYNIITKEWEYMEEIPEKDGVGDGASLLWTADYKNCIFALGGGSADEKPGYNFYCYFISNNSWKKLDDVPYPVGYYVGNRLAYADAIYYWQGSPSTWEGGGNRFCMYLLINSPPIANFDFYPKKPTIRDNVQFIDLSYDLDGCIINYTWEFGDGNISYERNPIHRYTKKGEYVVTLTVTDNYGVTSSVSKNIVIGRKTIAKDNIFRRMINMLSNNFFC